MSNKKETLTFSEIKKKIKEKNLSWVPEKTQLFELPIEEKKRYLGLEITEKELKQMKLRLDDQVKIEMEQFGKMKSFAVPTEKDWRSSGHVTDVKNQGSCGSCVSFGTCAAIEAGARIKSQNSNLDIDLSEAFLQFCGGGSCSGWSLTGGLEYAEDVGVTDEVCFPYQPQNMPCNNRCSDWQSRLTKINKYTAHATMQARKEAIANSGPVVAGMRVYDDFFAYSSGIYERTQGSSNVGLHCVCVVGYNDNDRYWIVKNSWGSNWGENGYVRIRYGQDEVLIDSGFAFYSVDVDIEQPRGNGIVQHMLVDDRFSGTPTLWAYAGNKWRHRKINQDAMEGLVPILFEADRVRVWWYNEDILLIRPWRTL